MVFSEYRVSSNYGWRIHPINKKRKFHAGIDLVKEHNSIISSFTNGIVLFAGLGVSGSGIGGYGNTVIIKDDIGNLNLYAHLNSVLVKKGQQVKVGSKIGRQGSTGQSTGSHLHYEVRLNESPSFGWTSQPELTTLDPKKYASQYNGKGDGRMLEILNVDGKRGIKTIKRWQQFLGTPVDGVLSKPSTVIKAWQTFLNKYGKANLKVDGLEGVQTIKEGQKFFGTVQDGKISNVSLYVKELQKFLNEYGR